MTLYQRRIRTISNRLLIAIFVVLLTACSVNSNEEAKAGIYPIDIANQFFFAIVPYHTVETEDVIGGTARLNFEPLVPPRQFFRGGHENWFRTSLSPDENLANVTVLEIPGHLFDRVDIWFKFPDGKIVHDLIGRGYPYADRKIKHAGFAFDIPDSQSEPVEIFIRMRNGVPINFAAILWTSEQWNSYVVNQRIWYGVFLGTIIILVIYNLFFGVLLKDKSYLYYVGYILSLFCVVLIYSGLPEEYIWTNGIRRIYVLLVASFGMFFGVGFVNSFLNIKQRYPSVYWVSTVVSALAVIFGLLHSMGIYLVPRMLSGPAMHLCLLLGCLYFISISLRSYLVGMKQARFLALSMVFLTGGLTIYFLYTYGIIRYNQYLIHAVEVGSLLEGIMLALALVDRINLLSQAKEKAETEALNSQRFFFKRLLQAQEADRETFSNTMHDSIGHGLLVLKQNMEKIGQLLVDESAESSKKASVEVKKQAAYCREILSDVRGMSHDLHPHLLKRLGLRAAVESTLERAFSSTDIEWNFEIETLPSEISKETEITIYRVIQECLNNILKHADASEVILSLRTLEDQLVVGVKDDGAGINTDTQNTHSLGLQGMEERIHLFGGWFSVQSVAGGGTYISFGLPVS